MQRVCRCSSWLEFALTWNTQNWMDRDLAKLNDFLHSLFLVLQQGNQPNQHKTWIRKKEWLKR
jgi:hypothetical protein